MKKVIILGAGISGLATAWYLRQKFGKAIDLTIIEQSDRVGGWIKTIQEGEFLFEQGPRGIRSNNKGKITHNLIVSLGLEKELLFTNPKTHTRYLSLTGILRPLSPILFLMRGGFRGILKDLSTPATILEDETIASFFTRRFGSQIAENFMDPLVKGIFAGNIDQLSMRSCFPNQWDWEQTKGSLLRGLLATKRGKKESLFTFKRGMETLPNALANQIDAKILLSTPITKIERSDHQFLINETHVADNVISALPTHALAKLMGLANPCNYTTISTVSLGWKKPLLDKRGYGFLVPTKEKGDILGMTFDSDIFPEQGGGQTRLCVMIEGSQSKQALLNIALRNVAHYQKIQEAPDACSIHTAEQAIPQYLVGHHKRIDELNKSLPPNMVLVGSSLQGVGVNDCIASAEQVAATFS